MPTRYKLLICVLVLSLAGGTGYALGWSAKGDSVALENSNKKDAAEDKQKPKEEKAAAASESAKVVYKTVYRDVVKYVQSPNRTKCDFDSDAVWLRQQAIDAANNIPGFDDAAVQDKPGGKQH